MNCQPGISVIAPSFNQGRFIRKMIESVASQSYHRWELIIVDGGSSDETVSVLRSFGSDPRIRCVSERDNGPVDAVNKGLAMARFAVGTIMSTDDYFLPDAFAEAVSAICANPDAVLVYAEYAKVFESGGLVRVPSAPYSVERLLGGATFVPQGASFFDISIARKLGGWDERVPYVPDTDLWFRIALTSKVVKCPGVWVGSHVHAGQRTNQTERVLRDYVRMLDQMKELRDAPRRVRRAARAGFYLARAKFERMSNWQVTCAAWKAVLLAPWMLTSGHVRIHRLVPFYFAMTSAYGAVRRTLGGRVPRTMCGMLWI